MKTLVFSWLLVLCVSAAANVSGAIALEQRMNRRQLISVELALAGTLITVACRAETDSFELIPLNKIWALDMPGAIDIRSLEPDCFGDVLKGKE